MIGEGRLTLDQIPSIIPFVMNRHVMSAPLSLSLSLSVRGDRRGMRAAATAPPGQPIENDNSNYYYV
jgi:hypothetical protein